MGNMMKAIVKARPEPGLWMQQVPVPEPGPTEVLIRVRKSAICGTDVHIWNWDAWAQATVPVPLVVGHEFCGEVADTGSAVSRFRIGQRVSGEGHIVCGHLPQLPGRARASVPQHPGRGVQRPGAFAEYLCLPQENVVAIPDDISDEVAACSTRWATPCTRRCRSIWWARTCWSPARGPSASWAR
jgi:threonine 3-dehydrogenase